MEPKENLNEKDDEYWYNLETDVDEDEDGILTSQDEGDVIVENPDVFEDEDEDEDFETDDSTSVEVEEDEDDKGFDEYEYPDEDLQDEDLEEMEAVVEADIFNQANLAERKKQGRDYLSDILLTSSIDLTMFNKLSDIEKELLPFNYIVTDEEEWIFIQEACASGFRSVKNLSKVCDKKIKLIADMSYYALTTSMSVLPVLNKAFIKYAEQRGI
jgi:hypothetical protein